MTFNKKIAALACLFYSTQVGAADQEQRPVQPKEQATTQAPIKQSEHVATVFNGTDWHVVLNYITPDGHQTNAAVAPKHSVEVRSKDSIVTYAFQKNGGAEKTADVSVQIEGDRLSLTQEKLKEAQELKQNLSTVKKP